MEPNCIEEIIDCIEDLSRVDQIEALAATLAILCECEGMGQQDIINLILNKTFPKCGTPSATVN